MRHQGEGKRAAVREREIGEHMKECISEREREREIDWDEEMRGRIKRGGGEIREWPNVEKHFFLL